MARKEYKVILKTKGPIHIGSGNTLSKNEYVHDYYNGFVYIFEPSEFIDLIIKKDLINSYENYMFQASKRKIHFIDWIKEVNLFEDIKKISYISAYVGRRKMINELQECIKTPDYFLYVPGSSLKGAIRTCLLGHSFMKNDKYKHILLNNSRNVKELEKRMSKVIREIENIGYGDNESSRMKYISISDSNIIGKENLVICQKIDDSLYSNNPNKLPTYREAIGPGVNLEFNMTLLDEDIISISDIKKAIEYFYECIDGNLLLEFDVEERDNNHIYLGGGSGFLSKTIIYNMLNKKDAVRVTSDILNRRFKKHFHNLDKELGLSPRTYKITEIGNEEYEFGLCEIDFKEIK